MNFVHFSRGQCDFDEKEAFHVDARFLFGIYITRRSLICPRVLASSQPIVFLWACRPIFKVMIVGMVRLRWNPFFFVGQRQELHYIGLLLGRGREE